MESLDRAIDESGVRDAGAYRIPGFPYLRVDRFESSFRGEAGDSGPAFDTWIGGLQDLDLIARRYELANLPPQPRRSIELADPRSAARRTQECGAILVREDLADPARRRTLIERAAVPDDYAGWTRKSGVYKLASVPFSLGVEGWHKEAAEMFRKAASGEGYVEGVKRFNAAGPPVSAAEVRAVLARAVTDPLGVPRPDPAGIETLFRAYAPQFEIETTGPYDRFGRLQWASASVPQVDTAAPVAYRRLAYTRYQGRTLIQLVYTVWFPERPPESRLDLLAGHLDGLVLRVTLDPDGRPLVYDTIHPCGCYHMFFPTGLVRLLDAPDAREEWAFVPATLPVLEAGQRVAVRMASKNHYVVSVRPVGAAEGETYALAGEEDLRALPLPGGGTRSLFGPDALVAGSERPERLLFWPMGIASAGTMRQWGRQPTAFVGRRHFDDADLVEKRFARRTGS